MARTFLIVDGYNLLHAAGLAKQRYAPGQMERSRRRLINLLARHLNEQARQSTTVVFDAHDAPPEPTSEQRHRGISVVYAPPGGDADSLIEQQICRHPAPKQVLVISSDRRLQRAASRRRGRWLDSESFHAWLLEPEEARDETPGKPILQSQQKPAPADGSASGRSETEADAAADDVGRQHSGSGPPADEVDQVEFWQQRVDELSSEQSRRSRRRRK